MGTSRALDEIRILDLSWVRAGPWATRILATLGADVIKVEWPAPGTGYLNDRRSNLGQPEDLEVTLNSSYWFGEKNLNKRSVTLNVRHERGLALLKQLLAVSDVVVENFTAGVMRSWGLGFEEMQALRPGIVYLSLSALGHTGRDSHYRSYGPSAQALAGLTYLSGLPGHPPAGWGWSYLDDTAGILGAAYVMAALHRRTQTGQGEHIDMSQVATGIPLGGAAVMDSAMNGRPSRREGFPPGNRSVWPSAPVFDNYRGPLAAPHNLYRTAPGSYNDWCAIVCESDADWRALIAVMGDPAWAHDARFSTLAGRLEHQEDLDAGIEAWTRTLDKYEAMTRCQAAGIATMPVQSNEDRVERDPQLQVRRNLVELPHPALGSMRYQNLPFEAEHLRRSPTAAAPLIGEHNREVFCGLLGLPEADLAQGYAEGWLWLHGLPLEPHLASLSPPIQTPPDTARPERTTPERASGGPLAGVRVLEVGERGQWCGRLLAELGAAVLKIEPPGGVDARTTGPFYRDAPHPDRSLSFWHYNAGKRAITLNLEHPESRGLFAQLAQEAEVVLDSTTPGRLSSAGVDYEELRARDRGLIVCSLTPFGLSGPWRDFRTTDLVQLAAGGQAACCGYDESEFPDAPPIAPGGGNAWHIGSHFALVAIMAALLHRDATGDGQHLDVSVHEACSLTTEAALSVYLGTGRVVRRQTGRHAAWSMDVPRTQYLCKDGTYVNAMFNMRITPQLLRTYAEWMHQFRAAEDLLDPRYEDAQTVLESQGHIAEVLGRFFSHITSEEAYRGAQQRGLPWGAVRTVEEILTDPHWHDRKLFLELEHPGITEQVTYIGPTAVWSNATVTLTAPAPDIGEHNSDVYTELGLEPEAIESLQSAGVI